MAKILPAKTRTLTGEEWGTIREALRTCEQMERVEEREAEAAKRTNCDCDGCEEREHDRTVAARRAMAFGRLADLLTD